MCGMVVGASSLPLIAIHTQPWQLLSLFLLQKLAAQDVKHLFGQHFYFFRGVNENNYKKWVQENVLCNGRNLSDFFIWLLLSQKHDFMASKGPFLNEKTKRCDI